MNLIPVKKIVILGLSLSALYLAALPALAADGKCPEKSPGCTNLIVQIPGFLGGSVTNPVDYILGIYRFSLSVGGLLAMAIIVFAAIKRIASAGNPSAIGDANDMITNAVWGLALLFGAFLILSTINPKLTNLHLETLDPVSAAANKNVYSNFDEVAGPLSAAQKNDLAKAQDAYDAAAKLAEDTEGIIADRQPDRSKWTPEQKARIAVAQYDQEVALYELQRAKAATADLSYNSVRASICGASGASCENGFIRGMSAEQKARLDNATRERDVTATNAQNTLGHINADATKISGLRSQYNIQLRQQ